MVSSTIKKYLFITDFVLDQPSALATNPVLGPLRDIDECYNCIAAKVGETPKIQCVSTGSIRLIELDIGNRVTCTIEIETNGIHTSVARKDECNFLASDHRAMLSCKVYSTNAYALKSEPRMVFIAGNNL